MQLRQALRLINSWAPFSKLSTEQKAKLAETIQPLRLRPGQKLYDFSCVLSWGSVQLCIFQMN